MAQWVFELSGGSLRSAERCDRFPVEFALRRIDGRRWAGYGWIRSRPGSPQPPSTHHPPPSENENEEQKTMKFHKRVPSFSFTSPGTLPAQLALPAPARAPRATLLSSRTLLPPQRIIRPPPAPRNGAITLLLSPDDPLQFIVQTAAKGPPPRKRSGSLIEHSLSSPPADHPDHPASASRRRSSFAESASQALTLADRGRIASPHRISTLTQTPSPTTQATPAPRAPPPAPPGPAAPPPPSTPSPTGRATPTRPRSISPHPQRTSLSPTTPNITSPPPLPISFAPTDPRSLLKHPPAMARKTSISSRPGGSIRRRSSLGPPRQDLKLTVSRPIYQKNRCTITIEHGDWLEAAKKAERTRFYLVACDLSDESKYAIEWTIGTVLRQGDECLVIMVIETDSKFDPEDGPGTAADRTAKIRNQKDRQEKATLLVREVTALLERTGLHAKVTCQAIHGKNPRHMLVDCIDFLEPNLVIVGRRGVTSSKGSLMGSVSHYLVQKSSVPVMVARRRLRTLPKVYKKKSGVVPTAHQQRKLNEAAIENALPPSTSAASSFAQLPSSPDSKRLSVVSEETEKLNLLGLRHASPEPSELVEDGEEGEEDQATQEDHQEPGRAQEPRDGQSDSDGKEERPDLADQDVSVPMPRQTDEGARPADPVVTPHPVSIVEPVI
ncbi:hypothetical protein PtA15_3A603 [Puccinia triticina]|uniref:UspA domain-containing protein n=1 Tax=Puccinia triticina TaxID=208348 RepID=A0ABY7CDG0_9BASI|nr:uncharacterized protein PtA15_3A603 [Puccinia triticina]WAQ83234.1 hypothetical protein PtA15_3A603 [Puccinia triticina]